MAVPGAVSILLTVLSCKEGGAPHGAEKAMITRWIKVMVKPPNPRNLGLVRDGLVQIVSFMHDNASVRLMVGSSDQLLQPISSL